MKDANPCNYHTLSAPRSHYPCDPSRHLQECSGPPDRKVPHGALFECCWTIASDCPKECFLSMITCSYFLRSGINFPMLAITITFPLLPFLVFFGTWHGKPPKKQGSSIPAEPVKSLEKKGKRLRKTRNSSQGKKRGIPRKQGKEGQGRVICP